MVESRAVKWIMMALIVVGLGIGAILGANAQADCITPMQTQQVQSIR